MIDRRVLALAVGSLAGSLVASSASACMLNGGTNWAFRKQPPASPAPGLSILKVRVLALDEANGFARVEVLDPVAGVEGERQITVRWDGRSDCTNAGEVDGPVFVIGRVKYLAGARIEFEAVLQRNPAYENR